MNLHGEGAVVVRGSILRHRPGLALTIRENRPPRTSSGSVELGVSPPILATLRYPLLVASRSRSQSSPGLSEHRPGSRRTAGPIDGVRIPVLDCVRRGLAAGLPRCGSAAPCHTATDGTTGASANKKAHLVGGRHCAQIVLNEDGTASFHRHPDTRGRTGSFRRGLHRARRYLGYRDVGALQVARQLDGLSCVRREVLQILVDDGVDVSP